MLSGGPWAAYADRRRFCNLLIRQGKPCHYPIIRKSNCVIDFPPDK